MPDYTLPIRPAIFGRRPPTIAVYLLGQVGFERALALQQRLVFDACTTAGGQITLLLCEHPPIITIGRGGSRADVQLENVLLAGRTLDIYRVNRGGGAVLHHPGQLAVYPIVPLDRLGWTVGEFLQRFQAGLAASLAELKIASQPRPGRYGLWGQSGQLASLGVSVKDWVTYYGAQIHVGPALHLQKFIDSDRADRIRIGSLCEESDAAVKMTAVRSRVVRCTAEAFGCEYHVYTDHPLLPHVLRGDRATLCAS